MRLAILAATSVFVCAGAGLRVQVVDPAGAPVPRAKVDISAVAVPGVTGTDGTVIAGDLMAGPAVVRVRAEGFAEWSSPVTLADGAETMLSVRLAIAAQRTEVTVQPSAPKRFWRWLTTCTRASGR